MRNDETAVSTRILTGLIVAGSVLLAGCSGGGDSATTIAPDPSPPATETAPPDPDDTPTPSSTPVTTARPPETTAAATTTTEPPPELLPIGAVWERSTVASSPGAFAMNIRSATVVGSELWLAGARNTAPTLWRSTDATTWEEIPVAPPPPSGVLTIDGLTTSSTGRLVAHGAIATDCDANLAGEGNRRDGLCRLFRPVVHLSDDGGATWRTIEPPEMAPPGGSSAVLEDVTVHGDQIVAAVTVRGPDWHGRLYTSTDGETWSPAGDVRGPSGFTSTRQLLSDGTTLALVAVEHPCSLPFSDTPSGWVLGTDSAQHQRLFVGPDAASLAQVANTDVAVVPEPIEYDCSIIDGFFIAQEPYPTFRAAVIGGTITLLDTTAAPEADDEAEAEEDVEPVEHTRRTVVRLVDGSWSVDVSEGLPAAPPVDDTVVDVGGRVALFRPEERFPGTGLRVLVRGDDGWSVVDPEAPSTPPVVVQSPRPIHVGSSCCGPLAVGFEESVIVIVREEADPFDPQWGLDEPTEYVAYRSVPTPADEVPVTCTIEPGGSCRFHDLSAVEGYPDFSGRDLAGVDLLGSDLGEAVFDGANLAGAVLAHVDGDGDATFVGANLTGVDVRQGDIGDVTGADLTGARLGRARIRFSELPILAGANLDGARLNVAEGAPPLSLVGLDLTNATIAGDFDTPVVITDVTGAVLERSLFTRADLSTAVGFDAVDPTTYRASEDTICPDGLPATGGLLGTCAR